MTVRFSIEAVRDPQSLPRIVGYFAQRWLTPAYLSLRETATGLSVEVDIADIREQDALVIAAKLEQNVLIFAASTRLLPDMSESPLAAMSDVALVTQS